MRLLGMRSARAAIAVVSVLTFVVSSSIAVTRQDAKPVAARAPGLGPAQQAAALEASFEAAKREMRSRARAQQAGATVLQPRAGGAAKPTMRVHVSVRPVCVTTGRNGTVTLKTEPKAAYTMMIVWPDGDPRGAMFAGRLGPDGTLRVPFIVSPGVPAGTASVWATAQRLDGSNAGWGTREFVVAGPGGCP